MYATGTSVRRSAAVTGRKAYGARPVAPPLGDGYRRQRQARVRRERSRRRLADELEAIAEHCANLPVLDSRSADEILGYDEQGLAR